MKIDAPIPGQSLTKEPRNYPWERPPETTDPDVAIEHHLSRFSKPKVMDSLLDAVNEGYPVAFVTEMVLSGGVMKGIHSIDISMMIAPVVHEYIVELLESEGVEFKEFFEDDSDADVRKSIALTQAISGVKEPKEEMEEPEEEEEMLEDEAEEEMPKRGLMAREVQ